MIGKLKQLITDNQSKLLFSWLRK